jgi:phosphate:Na+ symporter
MIVQSSSASVGILQALAITGKISFGAAIPIIMGQNIGTCITAILSSISANRNGKRAAMIHLLFNIIGVAFWLPVFYLVNWLIPFIDTALPANAWHIAIIHTIFKIVSVIAIGPFYKYLEKLACLIIKDKKDESEVSNKLDERLFATPSFAVEQATKVTYDMAEVSVSALKKSLLLLDAYDINLADEVRELETKADKFEDALGSYLVKLSSCDLSEQDSMQITKLLHIIGDLERISDHAVNVVESAEEMNDKKLAFSQEATREMSVFKRTVGDILDITYESLSKNDIKLAVEVEPIEEIVDDLRDKIKLNHIIRLQKSECTIEHGFILSDLLNNLERVSDHCSNIAGCVIEIATLGDLDMHKHNEKTIESLEFKQRVAYYREKYSL